MLQDKDEQTRLEMKHRKEEDDLYRKFMRQREEEDKRIKDEIRVRKLSSWQRPEKDNIYNYYKHIILYWRNVYYFSVGHVLQRTSSGLAAL